MESLSAFCEATGNDTLLRQWDTEHNGSLTPDAVSSFSHKKAWWRCEKGHLWQAEVRSRTRGRDCPVCAGRQVVPGENDLARAYPSLAKEWDFEKNGSLRPENVPPGTDRRVWWRCEKGHEWRASVSSRALQGTGCPYCAGKRVSPGENDLATVFPMLAAELDPEQDGDLSALSPYSNRRVWWRCEKGHRWQATVAARAMHQSGCPYCAGRKVLKGFNDLATKNPLVAADWDDELNGALTPEMVTAGSKKQVWWRDRFGHVWKTAVYSRARDGCGCPICAGKTGKRRSSPSKTPT